MKIYHETDNKFRFVIIASKRAKKLLQGEKPKVKSKSRNPIRVAQHEVREGLVDFEIIEPKIEEIHKPEEGFIGEEIGKEAEEMIEEVADAVRKKKKKSEDKPKKKVKKKPQEKGIKKKK